MDVDALDYLMLVYGAHDALDGDADEAGEAAEAAELGEDPSPS